MKIVHLRYGPHKMEHIDTYGPLHPDVPFKHPFRSAIGLGHVIRVDDATGDKVADAYCYAEDSTEARTWLLDFANITAGGG